MFLSKIWFFLVAVVAAFAVTVVLLLPRPVERQQTVDEHQRITASCGVVNILLRTNARSRIDLASKFARSELELGAMLGPAGGSSEISLEANKTARAAASQLMGSTTGAKPSFVILVDNRGRVVARAGVDDQVYGDSVAGYYLVEDALHGYLRDDLWIIDNQLYLVAASPVVRSGYAGAVIIGHLVDKEFAGELASQLGVHINVYAEGQVVASTDTAAVHKQVLAEYARVADSESPIGDDCRTVEPFVLDLGKESYTATLSRLPGQAGQRGAFFAVYVKRPDASGVFGMLGAVKQADLSFAAFPWIRLALGFIACVAVGMVLMIFETDRPLRRLNADAIALAQGESERLSEERHGGKFGSIARSVNIRIDKIEREARAKKTDLDDLLGPPSASALPIAGPGGLAAPAKPPPPSEFKFTDSKPNLRPPPIGQDAPPPPGMARAPSQAGIEAEPEPLVAMRGADDDAPVFRQVFDRFLELKGRCGESVDGITPDMFTQKLRDNRDSLMAKHGCAAVKFQVYVKDGKAALRATPVKS